MGLWPYSGGIVFSANFIPEKNGISVRYISASVHAETNVSGWAPANFFDEDITATIDVFKSIVFDDKNTYKMKVGLERNRKVFIFLQKLFGRMNIDF